MSASSVSVSVGTPSRRRNNKAKKDPNAPKGPKSAYILFTLDKRYSLIQANPDMKPKDILRSLGQEWKQAEPEVRQKYEELAKAEKQRYGDAMSSYVPPALETLDPNNNNNCEAENGNSKTAKTSNKKKSSSSSSSAKENTKAADFDPFRPKRATSAYFFFSAQMRPKVRAENPELKMTQVAKKLGELWSRLSDAERKPFLEMASKDKIRAEQEMEAYLEKKNNKEKLETVTEQNSNDQEDNDASDDQD